MNENEIQDKIKTDIFSGYPVYVRPYKEPKVWGVNGIGEYWYGAGGEGKNSQAVVNKEVTSLDKIMFICGREFLGKDVVAKFGYFIPLVKILTPKGRLSVQFHDAKNELWIITGIDKSLIGEDPKIILGFSPEVVEKYGKDVKKYYAEALKKYGSALNELIDELESKGYQNMLSETGNVKATAEQIRTKDETVAKKFSVLISAEQDLNRFYHYKSVAIGDVIPVSSGTLHALGAGLEVVEPQIAGPTQSLEDGATYPVRYYFPGHKRPTAQKKLDLDRINEMKGGVAPEMLPEVIQKHGGCTVERLPGNFADKGLEVRRLTMDKKHSEKFENINSFHTIVVVQGSAKVTIKEKTYDVPKVTPGGEMLIISAVAEKYTIVAGKEGACIIDTFTPV
ncbi:MAG: hypothetical protein ABIH85_00015 [Candidatus Omnitrophota bacterium]